MEQKTPLPPSPPSVITQIAQLSDMPIQELKDLWYEVFDEQPPIHARNFIERGLAYELQVRALNKYSRPLIKKNEERLRALKEHRESERQKSSKKSVALDPGTILTRMYQGEEYTVTINLSGMPEFNGQPYRSLSEIAREITGTRWSGPVFFGLKKPKKKAVNDQNHCGKHQ